MAPTGSPKIDAPGGILPNTDGPAGDSALPGGAGGVGGTLPDEPDACSLACAACSGGGSSTVGGPVVSGIACPSDGIGTSWASLVASPGPLAEEAFPVVPDIVANVGAEGLVSSRALP